MKICWRNRENVDGNDADDVDIMAADSFVSRTNELDDEVKVYLIFNKVCDNDKTLT